MKPKRENSHGLTADQLSIIRQVSKALIDQRWPAQSAIFEEYWPFFEKGGKVAARGKRQGAAEIWIDSPYVVGIVCGIATHLIIRYYPYIKSRLSGTLEQFFATIQEYFRDKPSTRSEFINEIKTTYSTHPDTEQVVETLLALIEENQQKPDGH